MDLDPLLLEILACPCEHHAPVERRPTSALRVHRGAARRSRCGRHPGDAARRGDARPAGHRRDAGDEDGSIGRTVDEELLDDADALAAARPGRHPAGAGRRRRPGARGACALAREAGVAGVAADGRPRAVVVVARSAARRWSATCSTALAGPGSPVPGLPGALRDAARVGRARSTWWSRCRCPGARVGPLAVATEAARRGCRLLTVGRRAVAARRRRAPGRAASTCPCRRRSARRASALWALAVPVLVAADALGLVPGDAAVLEATADPLDDVAERCAPVVRVVRQPGQVAGAGPRRDGAARPRAPASWPGVAARRAAAQLARNARHPAVSGVLPDAAAEVVATFDGPFVRGGRRPVRRPVRRDRRPAPRRCACCCCATTPRTRTTTSPGWPTSVAGHRDARAASGSPSCGPTPGPGLARHRRPGRAHRLRLGVPRARARPRPGHARRTSPT